MPSSTSSMVPGLQTTSHATKASFANFERYINTGRQTRLQNDPIAGRTENPDAWPTLANTLREYDMTKIGSYKEDIDTLLVFSGLFSAVIAAFSLEAFKLLQPDPNQTSVQLLSQISQQLNSFTVNPSYVNSSYQAPSMPTSDSKPSLSVILINLFWFLGLILGLVTASLGMLVKQWLREYLSNDSTSPQARARIRYSRHLSLERCKRTVVRILRVRPGGTDFLLPLPVQVAFPEVYHSVPSTFSSPDTSGTPPTPSDLGKSLAFIDPGPLLEETDLRVSSKHDDAIWSEADELFFDDRLVKDTIYMCLAEVDGPSTVNCVQEITKRRELKTEPSNLIHYGQDSVSVALVNTLMRGLGSQIHKTKSLQWETWMGEAYILLLDNWQYCSEEMGKPHLVDLLLAVIMQDWKISEHVLRWKPQISLSVMSFALDHPRSVDCSHQETAFLLHQVVRSIRAFLTLGPFPSPDFAESFGPVYPGTLDLAAIMIVVLKCFYYARLDQMTSHENNRRALELTSELKNLGDAVVCAARSLLERDEQCAQWDTANKEDWKSAESMFVRLAYNMEIAGTHRHLNLNWVNHFRELHQRSEKLRAKSAKASSQDVGSP